MDNLTSYDLRKHYHACGHGVNEVEALRQEIITELFLLGSCNDVGDVDMVNMILDKLERLAKLAGAEAYQ